MAQLIFVHGVATRSSAELDRTEANMAALYAATVFSGKPFKMRSPRWGDYVPVIPDTVYQTNDSETESFRLGVEDDVLGGLGGSPGDGPTAAEEVQRDPKAAVDAILSALLEEVEAEGRQLTPVELDLFAKAVDAVDDNSRSKALLGDATTDDALVFALTPDTGSYSLLSPFRKAVDLVTGRVRQAATLATYGLVRDAVRPAIGLFLGDVFAYLHKGDLRSKIQTKIREGIIAAWQARGQNEPLIIVGHSMGGVILIDMLTDLAASGLPADLRVDCLITVGSQAGLFRALGALTGGEPGQGAKADRPTCVGAWLNVRDPLDPLAFNAEPIFEDVTDLSFDSVTGVISAHTTYFKRPQFYARLRERLGKLSLLR